MTKRKYEEEISNNNYKNKKRKLNPETYNEYLRLDKLFEYAFPEGKDEVLNKSNLYEAGYSNALINIIVKNIRQKANLNDFWHSANDKDIIIKLLDTHVVKSGDEKSKNLGLKEYLKTKIPDISKEPASKVVIIFPFAFNGHAHSVVIHLDKKKSLTPIANIFLNNPYGTAHLDNDVYNRFKTEINDYLNPIGLSDQIKPSFAVIQDDLQGFHYDFNNCGILAIYNIELYVQYAKANKKIEEYTIPSIVFDQFPDKELNQMLHKALMLRLKLDQLSGVLLNKETLGFQDLELSRRELRSNKNNLSYNKEVIKSKEEELELSHTDRVKKAVSEASDLLAKVINSATIIYAEFIHSFQENLTQLSLNDQIKLLNLISSQIIEKASSNLLNPPSLSEILTYSISYIENPNSYFISDEMHKESSRISWYFLQAIQSMLFKGPILSLEQYETDLIRVVKSVGYKDYLSFISALTHNQMQEIIDAKDHYGKTALIYAVLQGNELIVKDLVKRGANLDVKSSSYQIGIKLTLMEINALEVSAFESNNIEIFNFLLEATKIKYQTEFPLIVTNLLYKVISYWSHHKDKFQSEVIGLREQFIKAIEDNPLSGRCKVIDILLSNGADPFYTETMHYSFDPAFDSKPNIIPNGLCAFKIVGGVLDPAITRIFLQHFPDKIGVALFSAINYLNIELVKNMIEISNNRITQELIEAALKIIDTKLSSINNEEISPQTIFFLGSNDPSQNNKNRIFVDQLQIIKNLLLQLPHAEKPNTEISPYTLFIEAAKEGDIKFVKSSIENGVIKNINLYNEAGYNALLCATKNGHFEVVSCLLENSASLDVISSEGIPPEGYAISFPHILKYLLENNFITSCKAKFSNSGFSQNTFDLLCYASRLNALESVKLLLQTKLLHTTISQSIQEAAIVAARLGNNQILKYLICNGAKLDQRDKFDNLLIHHAASQGNLEGLELMLDHCPNIIDEISKTWRTPIMAAANKGHFLVVQELIHRGANINIVVDYTGKKVDEISLIKKAPFDNYFKTALTEAFSSCNYKIITFLIEKGATLNFHLLPYSFSHKFKILLNNAAKENNPVVLKKILENLPDSYEKEGWVEEIIHISLENKNFPLVKIIIESEKKDINNYYYGGKKILHYAASQGYFELVQYFIEIHNAKITKCTRSGDTVLHYAVQSQNIDLVKYIFSKCPSSLEESNDRGNAPIHEAVLLGNCEIVKVLIQQGANIHQENKFSETPLMLAQDLGHTDIIEALIDAVNTINAGESHIPVCQNEQFSIKNHPDLNSKSTDIYDIDMSLVGEGI
ncbi:MAG: ankyrin-3 isoform [Rickettsiaceae bacterium]|jgi:ankyrin repeat protein|nr:ankyrin-3 isoform [Rickettsiaceae bacterium]